MTIIPIPRVYALVLKSESLRGGERLVKEKISVFGLLFILVTVLTLGTQEVEANTSEKDFSVAYQSQEKTYYCGPAAVQMALNYISSELPSQDQLASEMDTDPIEGVTYTDMIAVPFSNRDFEVVYEGIFELEDLKIASNNDFLTIILIYFSSTHEYQHYILVINHNDSGIFVHDPWPTSWSQPQGRVTGQNVFISNEQLADLWACEPSNWGLAIPYSKWSSTTPTWWHQYWYVLIITPLSVTAILIIVYIKRKQTPSESLNEDAFSNLMKPSTHLTSYR